MRRLTCYVYNILLTWMELLIFRCLWKKKIELGMVRNFVLSLIELIAG